MCTPDLCHDFSSYVVAVKMCRFSVRSTSYYFCTELCKKSPRLILNTFSLYFHSPFLFDLFPKRCNCVNRASWIFVWSSRTKAAVISLRRLSSLRPLTSDEFLWVFSLPRLVTASNNTHV